MNSINGLQQTPKNLARILRDFREQETKLKADSRLSYEAKAADLSKLRDSTRSQLDAMRTEFDRQATTAKADMARTAPALSDQEALLREVRAPRLWARMRAQLDAGVTVGEIIEEADRESLDVLQQEFSGYARIRFPDSATRQHETEKARSLIDQRLPALLSPEEAKDFGRRKSVEMGITNVQSAFNWAYHALDEGGVEHLPDWQRGTSIRIMGE